MQHLTSIDSCFSSEFSSGEYKKKTHQLLRTINVIHVPCNQVYRLSPFQPFTVIFVTLPPLLALYIRSIIQCHCFSLYITVSMRQRTSLSSLSLSHLFFASFCLLMSIFTGLTSYTTTDVVPGIQSACLGI
jgi:hypothetical protein